MRVLTFLLLCVMTCASYGVIAGELRGNVVGISDGDTLKLLVGKETVKVRLAEIDTPEKSQPWGNRAKQALGNKVFRKDVRVQVVTKDRYGRTVGHIWLGSRDINREMVREGHAWVYRRYMKDKSLLDDEAYAKNNGLGLWSLPDAVPPWEWRRGKKGNTTQYQKKQQKNATQASTCGSKTTCKQMTDCAEARFYLKQCGLGWLDGDNDGVPCESICR